MDVRTVVAALMAVSLASCSGGVYDASDFVRRQPDETTSAQAPSTPSADETEQAAAAETADASEATSDLPDVPGDPDPAPPSASDPTTTAATTPAATPIKAASTPSGGGLLAMFGISRDAPAAASEPAAEAATEIAAVAPQTSIAAAPDVEEITEAELAGEVEADPDEIAPPEMPKDGLAHDFVNVYTSRPDKPIEMIEGLPGVNWQGGLILASRTPDDGSLFGGADHPFARTVPGIPNKVVQAANGLLLAHSAINVSCIKPQLLSLVRRAESHFGKKVVITSGYRSPAHNRRVRGALHSQHMYCAALDLFMPGVARDDLARYFFAQPDRGGIGLYCHTRSIHVDVGKKRQWRWPCRRKLG